MLQDNRYENQRYTLKAGSVNDPEESNNDDVFDVSSVLFLFQIELNYHQQCGILNQALTLFRNHPICYFLLRTGV